MIERYADFEKARDYFREYTASLAKNTPRLQKCQQALVDADYGGKYRVERPVVYNSTLDTITEQDTITIILVGDNPGRREQETGHYLIGPSGKLAENFFRAHPALGVDFRKNTLILNKTPIHTPRTADLKKLPQVYRRDHPGTDGEEIAQAIRQSQLEMVSLARRFHAALRPVQIWIAGYSEMRKNGIFSAYTQALFDALPHEDLYFYRHFSMNQFSIDYNRKAAGYAAPNAACEGEILRSIGIHYRERIQERIVEGY
jgi:hypothetical protein